MHRLSFVRKRLSHGVLQPSLLDYGWSGLLQPRLDFATGYCSYECNRCGQVCPTGAILPLALVAKQTVQLGVAHFVRDNCIVYTDHTACGACDEYCPTKAVHMIPYRDGLTIPRYDRHCASVAGLARMPARPGRIGRFTWTAIRFTNRRFGHRPSRLSTSQIVDFRSDGFICRHRKLFRERPG